MKKSGRPASTRVVSRSAGKKSSKALAPLNLPEDDDDGAFRPRKGKKRSKETAAKIRENFDHEIDIDVEQLAEDSDKKIDSKFKHEFAAIKKRLETQDIRVEDVSAAFFRTSFSLVNDLMPLAESNYRKTGKEGAAYVISTLINQARDLQNDMRLSEDVEGRIATMQTIVHSAFVRIAELLLREMKYNMSTAVDSITSNGTIRKAIRKQMEMSILSYGKGLRDFEALLNKQIALYMQGDPNYLNPGNSSLEKEDNAPKKKRKKKVNA